MICVDFPDLHGFLCLARIFVFCEYFRDLGLKKRRIGAEKTKKRRIRVENSKKRRTGVEKMKKNGVLGLKNRKKRRIGVE